MTMRMLRRPAAVFAAVTAIFLTAACGGGSGGSSGSSITAKPPTSGTLTMVTKFADPQYAPYFKTVVADYEKAHPGVKIDLQQVGDQPYKDKIKVLTASGELPDIYFSWAGDFTAKFVKAGYAADLTSVVGPDTTVGKTLSPAAVKTFTYSGKVYGAPIDLDGKFMAYNTAAFAKAGISAPPASLGELLTDCDALKGAGYVPIAFGNQFGWPALHYITQLNAYDVPKATLAKDYKPSTGRFTDPGYVEALQQFQQILSRCTTSGANGVAHEAAQAQLIEGKAGMQYLESLEFKVLTASGGAPASTADNWNFFQLPAASGSKGDTSALTGAPDGFLINKKSSHAALAADFIKFFLSQQNAQSMVKDLGWLSPVSGSAGVASYPQLGQALTKINGASQFAVWLDTVTATDVSSAYLAGVEGLVGGNMTPDQVMKSVQAAAKTAQQKS